MASLFFWIPEVGPILFAGPVVTLIAGTLEGKCFEARPSVLAPALQSIGISNDSIQRYEEAIETGKLMLAVQGSANEVEKAMDSGGNPPVGLGAGWNLADELAEVSMGMP